MGKGCMKRCENVYFRARKEAAKLDPRLTSREGAAELLGVSVSTLTDYELGNTKVVPVGMIPLMASLYHCPELKAVYCRCECPIGKGMPVPTSVKALESIVLRFLLEFDPGKLADMRAALTEIASDGVVDEAEAPEFQVLLGMTKGMSKILSELRLAGEKSLDGTRARRGEAYVHV